LNVDAGEYAGRQQTAAVQHFKNNHVFDTLISLKKKEEGKRVKFNFIEAATRKVTQFH